MAGLPFSPQMQRWPLLTLSGDTTRPIAAERDALVKPMKYKRIVVTKRGPPENMQITECDLRDPSASEIRVKVLATCICLPDVQARYGLSPFAPEVPFVPGYAIVGVIDAAGRDITHAALGAKVAAHLVVGGYSEYVYLPEDQIIPVPPSLNPAEAVTLVLNYVVAYQALHRSAKVKAGDKVLIIGASGGCGTAFLAARQARRPHDVWNRLQD